MGYSPWVHKELDTIEQACTMEIASCLCVCVCVCVCVCGCVCVCAGWWKDSQVIAGM